MDTLSALLALGGGGGGGHPINGEIFSQMASNTKLWGFLFCQAEQAVEQTIELTVMWDVMELMRRPCQVMTIGVIFNPKLISEFIL